MNPKGNKPNLKASHPGNTHAQKTGLYSESVKAEEARKVREDLDEDPRAALDTRLRDRYCELEAFTQLLHEDLVEQGVSDRHGKQRRQAGSYLRSLTKLQELDSQIRTDLDTAAFEKDDTPLWGERAILLRLQAIADNHELPGGARVRALELCKNNVPEEEESYDLQFYREIENWTDEELQRELDALRVPITTGRPKGQSKAHEHPRDLIRRLASQDMISDYDLGDLRDSLRKLFDPFSNTDNRADG